MFVSIKAVIVRNNVEMKMQTKIIVLLLLWFCFKAALPADGQISARQAFRTAVEKQPDAFRKYLDDKDPEIRRYALYLLVKKDGVKAIPQLAKAIDDNDVYVQFTAAEALAGLAKKAPKEVQPLLEKVAANAKNNDIRHVAVKASWPFQREIKLLRNDPTWDYEVVVVKTLDLPTKDWNFITDPRQNGHNKGYFKPRFNDKNWRKMDMGYWEFQGVEDYDGVAWYRIKFRMPEKMDHNAVEIIFDGVDESAWVWLNGKYLGCHDEGQEGVGKRFAVDCTKEVAWGQENVLAVRIGDTANAGGITKPVHVEILK